MGDVPFLQSEAGATLRSAPCRAWVLPAERGQQSVDSAQGATLAAETGRAWRGDGCGAAVGAWKVLAEEGVRRWLVARAEELASDVRPLPVQRGFCSRSVRSESCGSDADSDPVDTMDICESDEQTFGLSGR